MNQVTKHEKTMNFQPTPKGFPKRPSQVHMAHQRLLELRAVVKDPQGNQGMPKLTVPRTQVFLG